MLDLKNICICKLGEKVVLGVLIGRVPDNESGFHTQGCVLTQMRPVLGRGVYKAANTYMAVCICKCAVTSSEGYGT